MLEFLLSFQPVTDPVLFTLSWLNADTSMSRPTGPGVPPHLRQCNSRSVRLAAMQHGEGRPMLLHSQTCSRAVCG